MKMVEICAELVRANGYDLLIGLGGGSPIDIAKLAAVLGKHQVSLSDMWGINNVPAPGLPTILIPTTSGSGSEVTPIAIITDPSDILKKGVVSHHLFSQVAICDPQLTLGMPPSLTACTGMDALTHAVEAFISTNASPLSDAIALEKQ